MSADKPYSQQRTYVSSPPPLSRHSVPTPSSSSSAHRTHTPSQSLSSYTSSHHSIPQPPQAAVAHPGPGARRRSDYLEQQTQPYAGSLHHGVAGGRSIDYPQAHPMVQPPPAVQNHAMERYDTRPAVVRSGSIRGLDLVAREGDEVRYWNDVVLGLTGLKNLGK